MGAFIAGAILSVFVLALVGVLFVLPAGWIFMLTAGVIHATGTAAFPAVGFWTATSWALCALGLVSVIGGPFRSNKNG